jgi:flagellin-like hook-associated protein FlgL
MADITLTGGLRANLIALQQTQIMMETTQGRLATGKRVNTALDDPLIYFSAQKGLDKASDLGVKKDQMNEAIATVKAGANGIEAITSLLKTAQGIVQSAQGSTDSTERARLATQYMNVVSQINTLASDAGYKGTNLLTNATLVVSLSDTSANTLAVIGFNASIAGLSVGVGGTADWSSTGTGDAYLTTRAGELTSALSTLRLQASNLSSNLNIVQTRLDFTDKMISTLKEGSDKLTRADMTEEGANLLMLQTRSQLGAQALSMSAQLAQSVLTLLR